MQQLIPKISRTILLGALCFGVAYSQKSGQTQSPSPQHPTDDVIRVNTELVQTDVTVLDKRGRVVAGLKPEQFELRVDAKPQSLAFFEQVATGSAEEEKQLAAVRSWNVAPLAKSAGGAGSESNRGRLIFFFVDDVHLAGESLIRARTVLINFVENRMAGNDRVAIVSTSGQIGFLQQLTDNKAVLREAISRLNARYNPETTASHVPISEVDANLIASGGDRGLFGYLVAATMKELNMSVISAVNIVKNRVSQINAQSKLAEIETLSRLESLMRSTTPLAGRKLLFFISDGFVVDTRRSSGSDVMRRVANEAARVGVVIYTLDTRSSFAITGVDASNNGFPDSPRTSGRSLAENKTPQEPMETLAEETGGRSYLNANALDDGVSQALAESSVYYLLAWRPDTENQRAGKSRIDVIVKGRPDLRVRMRRHSVDFKLNQTAKMIKPEGAKPLTSTPEDDLRMVLGSLYPRRDLPTSVSVSFLNTADKGTVLNVLMQIDTEMLSFEGLDGKQQAVVDVLGVALDDRGQFSSFKQKLEIPREAALAKGGRFVKWSQSLPLPPGLYQVRVAVRDRQSGRTGSAIGWIEIPRVGSPKK